MDNKEKQLQETATPVAKPLVEAETLAELQSLVSERVGKVSEKAAAKALKKAKGDVKKAAKSLREDLFKERFEQFDKASDGKHNWKQDVNFKSTAIKAVNDALASLPDALILEQQIFAEDGTDVYAQFLTKVFGPQEFIGAGEGKTYVKEYLSKVISMDEDNYIPQSRNDVDNYSKVCDVRLNDDIKQAWLSVSPWLYVKYFLSGKVDEYCAIAIGLLAKNIVMKQFFDGVAQLKTVWDTIRAKTSSGVSGTTNNVEGTKTGYLDALSEFELLKDKMQYHNQRFGYKDNLGVPYFVADKSKLIHIVDNKTMEAKKKYMSTFLSKEGVAEYFSNWIVIPEEGYNPFTQQIEKINIFTTEEQGETVALDGCILTINPEDCHRLANLNISNVADFPFNLTAVHSHFSRYNIVVTDWAVCSAYHNDALVADFVVPVEE